MNSILIKNALIVNEGIKSEQDILIQGDRIERIDKHITADVEKVIDASGKICIPGMIDDQVHFRDPGFPEKGSIPTESSAAVAGGITSFMDMPNTKPKTINEAALKDKLNYASQKSWANYGFYLGATNDNIEDIKSLDPNLACGIKVFMGASTGNMLVDNPEVLAEIFRSAPTMVVTHCEDTPMILENEKIFREKYGEDMSVKYHGEIRSRESCLKSSNMAVDLAKQHGTKLHVLHLSTEDELKLFKSGPLADKQITVEVCVHHLFFSDEDYDKLGSKIKWNPAIKRPSDRKALQEAVANDIIDVIATDHAPHTWSEKNNDYWSTPSGGPLVQHALLSLLELFHQGVFTLEKIVQKTSHAPAELYQVQDRGFLREGYFADIAIIDIEKKNTVQPNELLYHCGWSPFEGYTFKSSIHTTIVNGNVVFEKGKLKSFIPGTALKYNR